MREEFFEIRELQGDRLPDVAERALLERHRPRLFLPQGQDGPIDFYADYISSGCLTSSSRPEPDCEADQAKLNEVRNDPTAIFTHAPSGAATTPVGYGTVYRGSVTLPGLEPERREWLFLRYNFTFARSGIAVGIPKWQELLLGMAGDLHDWHQLDHYTAAVVVLDESDSPVAVMLQQHNYMHTYLVGVEPAFPREGPFSVDVALRSNEFYPHREGEERHRAANFIDAGASRWIATGEGRGMTHVYDHTSGDVEVDYRLDFLPQDDAFYIFAGRLGEKRRLPGRDGPPGAIFYTLPSLWRYEIALPMFYWTDGDDRFAELMAGASHEELIDKVLPPQQRRLAEALVSAGLVR